MDFATRQSSQNERLIWTGQPSAFWCALRDLPRAIGASALVGGFAYYKLFVEERHDSEFSPEGTYFLFFVSALILMEPVFSYIKAKRTTYFITAQRVGSTHGVFTEKIWTLPNERMGPINITRYASGIGSIYFSEIWSDDGDGGTVKKKEGFVAIPDYERVAKLLESVSRRGEALPN